MNDDITSARAIAYFIRVTSVKARHALDITCGKSVGKALNVLEYAPQDAANPAAKVVASVATNAENNFGLDRHTLVISEVCTNEGPTVKRLRPHTQGHALHAHKHISHITMVAESQEEGDR